MSSDLNIDVCIMSVLGIHMSVHGTSLSVQFDTLKNFIPFPAAPGNFHCELACNPFMIGLDSAYRQEIGNLYIHGLSLSVLVKNGSVHMVSFPVTFLPKYV